MKPKKKTLIIIGLVVVLAGFAYWYFNQPVSLPALSSEAQIYHIQSNGKYPKFLEVVIDPLKVKVGETQKIIVKLEDPSGIDWVRAEIEHDGGIDEIGLKLTEKQNIWFGIWKPYSTHSRTYHTAFIAQNIKGEQNSIALAWSTPCSPPKGGDWTLDGSCSISGVNGVDNGNFTVDGGHTLTIQAGAIFAWNPGKSISIVNGSIAIAAGGQLKQTYLWMTDADGDGYAPDTIQYAQDAAPPDGRRRHLLTLGIDCCDNDAKSRPGATYQRVRNACNSWDWNCDGRITKRNCYEAISCYKSGDRCCARSRRVSCGESRSHFCQGVWGPPSLLKGVWSGCRGGSGRPLRDCYLRRHWTARCYCK